ncbi:MAG: DUF2271 domain-containing protein [Candidatus Krumholzibacteriota bacterium]|nr:DUF2271 domain-containing protein [Candidatus Krumholzibacteriota bacterium]
MKLLTRIFIFFLFFISAGLAYGTTLEEYIKKAAEAGNAGDPARAAEIMEKAVEEYPDSASAHAYLGLFYGIQAGTAQDFMAAGQFCSTSFTALDKAVLIDPDSPSARLYRGLMGVNVPVFLGKLEGGIIDLECLIDLSRRSPGLVSAEHLLQAYDLLGTGYQKNEDIIKACGAWEKIKELSPGSETALQAEAKMKKYCAPEVLEKARAQKKESSVREPTGDAAGMLRKGKAAFQAENYDEAEKLLREALRSDSENAEINKWLGYTIGRQGEKGYDKRIAEDTDLRSGLVFEAMGYLDKAVTHAPDDIELRLNRGQWGILFPFFAGKLDQGIEDLEYVLRSDASDSAKAMAQFYLGLAHQKKALTCWIKVATKHSQSEAAELVYRQMRPDIKHVDLSAYTAPFLLIDFVLGFQDELPPQIGIWIEGPGGEYIKTVYVSGFSGYVEDKQIVLPAWAESSEFRHTDGVTGASIDIGHHVFIWDITDHLGKKVESGDYTVKVEVSHWPSMKYQLVAADINIGKKRRKTIVEEGKMIPYLEVEYFPKNVESVR